MISKDVEKKGTLIKPGFAWRLQNYFWKIFGSPTTVKVVSFIKDRQMHIGFYRMINRKNDVTAITLCEIAESPEGARQLIKQMQHSLDTWETFHAKK